MSIQTLFNIVAGLDVHKQIVVVTLQKESKDKTTEETREFGAFKKDLQELAKWLAENHVELAVMESTGVYWRAVYKALEERSIQISVVNARHIKKVPGRKTDVTDSQWLASLGRCGLVRASFVPDKILSDLRLLTRQRKKLIHNRASVQNRMHKILDNTGIRISNVLSSINGVAAQTFIEGLINGATPDEIIKSIKTVTPKKRLLLKELLAFEITPSHLIVLKQLHLQMAQLNDAIDYYDAEIEKYMNANYKESWELLQTIPGIKKESAAEIIAEVGTDMQRFGSAKQLCSWAGLCPGNNESAGKKKVQKCAKGIRY